MHKFNITYIQGNKTINKQIKAHTNLEAVLILRASDKTIRIKEIENTNITINKIK